MEGNEIALNFSSFNHYNVLVKNPDQLSLRGPSVSSKVISIRANIIGMIIRILRSKIFL